MKPKVKKRRKSYHNKIDKASKHWSYVNKNMNNTDPKMFKRIKWGNNE